MYDGKTPGEHIAWGDNYSGIVDMLLKDASEDTRTTLKRVSDDLGVYVKGDLAKHIDAAIAEAIRAEQNRIVALLRANGYRVAASALVDLLAVGTAEGVPDGSTVTAPAVPPALAQQSPFTIKVPE